MDRVGPIIWTGIQRKVTHGSTIVFRITARFKNATVLVTQQAAFIAILDKRGVLSEAYMRESIH